MDRKEQKTGGEPKNSGPAKKAAKYAQIRLDEQSQAGQETLIFGAAGTDAYEPRRETLGPEGEPPRERVEFEREPSGPEGEAAEPEKEWREPPSEIQKNPTHHIHRRTGRFIRIPDWEEHAPLPGEEPPETMAQAGNANDVRLVDRFQAGNKKDARFADRSQAGDEKDARFADRSQAENRREVRPSPEVRHDTLPYGDRSGDFFGDLSDTHYDEKPSPKEKARSGDCRSTDFSGDLSDDLYDVKPSPKGKARSGDHRSADFSGDLSDDDYGDRYDVKPSPKGKARSGDRRSADFSGDHYDDRYDVKPSPKGKARSADFSGDHYGDDYSDRYDVKSSPKGKARSGNRRSADFSGDLSGDHYDDRYDVKLSQKGKARFGDFSDDPYDVKSSPKGKARSGDRRSGDLSDDRYDVKPSPKGKARPDSYDYNYNYGYNYDRRPSSQKRRKAKARPRIAVFYLALLFCGVFVTIILFALILSALRAQNPGRSLAPTATPLPSSSASLVQEVNQVTGVVKAIERDLGRITVLDPASGKSWFLTAAQSTSMMDKYHSQLAFGEFAVGDIVNASFDVADFTLTELSESSQSWSLSMKRDVAVDADAKTVTVANDTYFYNDYLLALYKDGPFDPAGISPSDTVTVSGVLNQAWVVVVNKSHGFLRISNIDSIKGGAVEIDTNVFAQLSEDSPVTLPEGAHRLVIRGENTEPYTKDITILPGETLYIDAGDVRLRSGLLNVIVSEAGYSLTIDGARIDDREPIPLDYGAHGIRVEKEGYEPVERDVTVNQPIVDVYVTLEKSVMTASVTVTSVPEGAFVYLDNALLGATPVTERVEAGSHTLIVSMDGYKTVTIPIELGSADMLYPVELQPERLATPQDEIYAPEPWTEPDATRSVD